MSVQQITAKRVFILGHGAYVADTLSLRKESVHFYCKQGQYLDRCLIPGFFHMFDKPAITMRELIHSSRVADEYIDYMPCVENLNKKEEHILFMTPSVDDYMLMEPVFGVNPNNKDIEQLELPNSTEQCNLKTFLNLIFVGNDKILARSYRNFIQVDKMPVTDLNFEIYIIQKENSILAGDIVIIPARKQHGCCPLSDIIVWIQEKCPCATEIHWMACRDLEEMNL